MLVPAIVWRAETTGVSAHGAEASVLDFAKWPRRLVVRGRMEPQSAPRYLCFLHLPLNGSLTQDFLPVAAYRRFAAVELAHGGNEP